MHYQLTEVTSEHNSETTDLKSTNPSVSAIDDELFKTSLSAAFMKNAEVSQPWSTIGVDQWIESGRWWLLRSQMESYTITEAKKEVPLAAYTNLIKASWILVDIIASHPQVPFIAASTHSEVQLLSGELKNEFSRLSTLDSIVPDLSELEEQDLRIWETQAKGPLLRPHKDSRNLDEWTVDGGEQVLFQRFALCKLHALTESLPCILLFLVHGKGKSARLVAQNQNGSIIMDVAFQKPVEAKEWSSSVTINDEKITFTTVQDAQFLACLIEATNFYYFGRRAKHASLEDLKAYVLITAVKNRREDAVARLLQRTALKEKTPDSESDREPVVVASLLASQQIAHQLNEEILPDSNPQRSTISLFSWAVQCGLATLVRTLLIEQPTIDGDDWHGMTPLGLASFCGYEPVVRLLIVSEANVRVTDSWGCVALHHACFKGHERVVRLLLRNGAEVGGKATKDKTSALHFAVRNSHENVVQLLIDRGADIEAENLAGFTPLCEATSLKHESIIALLLEEGADVNRRNKEGLNATHFALESKMSDSTVRAILARQLSNREMAQNSLDEAEVRKERVVLELDSDWGKFYLDSPSAVIEMPKDTPSNIDCAYDKTISITRPSGISAKFFKFEFDFTVIHSEKSLDIAIGHGTLGTTQSGGWFKVKIVNGGERVGRPTRLHGRNFQRFIGVELDRTAKTGSSEDRKVYRQVKDQLYKNLSWIGKKNEATA